MRNISEKPLNSIVRLMAIVAVLVSMILPVNVSADIGVRKIINVVFDDSTSMLWNNETRWCQAKYALEVFVAMMGEQDVMNIHVMNSEDVLTVSGNDPDRVAKVHAMNSMYGETPLDSVIRAGDALLTEDPSAERWLVILTDGQFYASDFVTPMSRETVQATVDGYSAQGLRTVYLGIGNDAAELRNDPASNTYAEKAASTGDILTKVTSIANQIFEHQVLPDRHISRQGNNRLLDIDIPTSQIIVFAQGENASVGNLKLDGNEIRSTSVWTVRHSGDVMPLNTEYNIVVDTTLHGVLAVFESGNSSFEAGTYEVEVSNETQVEYYYRPSVKVNCELYQGTNIVPPNSVGIAAGAYDVRMNFIHPVTREVIHSDLLDNVQFRMTAVNNGSEQVIEGTSGTVTLEAGEVDISASAVLPGNVVLTSQKQYSVMRGLEIRIEGNPGTFMQDELVSAEPPSIVVRVVNADTGEPINPEAVQNIQFTVDSGKGGNDIEWSYKYNGDGTWSFTPKSADGKMKRLKTGNRDISISASYTAGNDSGAGNVTIPIVVGEYQGSRLKIEISPGGPYDLRDYLKGDYMKATVSYQNPETGREEIITEEMWKKLHLETDTACPGGKKVRLGWDIKKGEEAGTYLIKPVPYMKLLTFLTSSGEHELTLSGNVKNGEYTYSGSTMQNVTIIRLPLLFMAIRIAEFLLALFIIIGYIKKPRIKTFGKDFYPVCIKFQDGVPAAASGRRQIQKEFLSVIIPYVPEKALVRSGAGAYGCACGNMRIIAYSNSQFQILSDMPVQRIKISGKAFKDNKELKKMIFGYSGFRIDTMNKDGLTDGRFTFRKPKDRSRKKNKTKRKNNRKR